MMPEAYRMLGEEICGECERAIKSLEEGVLESWKLSLPRLRQQAVSEWAKIRRDAG